MGRLASKNTFIITYCLLVLLLFTAACKKEAVEIPESHLFYELNGVPHSFSSKTDLTFSFVGWIQTLHEEKPTSHLELNAPKLSIVVKDHVTPIGHGTYSGKTYYSNGWTKEVAMSYWLSSDSIYQSTFLEPETTIHITAISRKGVKGTFNGKLVRSTLQGLDSIRITNGSFAYYTYEMP